MSDYSDRGKHGLQTTGSAALPENLRQTGTQDSTYHIRGGGYVQKRDTRSNAILSLILAVALIVAGMGASRWFKTLNGSVTVAVIDISTQDSHHALSGAPHLLDFVPGDADGAYDWLKNSGFSVHFNDRTSSSNPDQTSSGAEIVCLPPEATEEDLSCYYETEFSGFDFDDLQHRLLGAWMMEISNGNRGTFLEFKYANLATEGQYEEMHWLLDQQGLVDSQHASVILSEGRDQVGNSCIEGYTVINDEVIFWRILSCIFNARYSGSDGRKLPDTSVYVKLRIANWDFYDAHKIISQGQVNP
jgi:hypothetical protein